jgi:hypothetical protein
MMAKENQAADERRLLTQYTGSRNTLHPWPSAKTRGKKQIRAYPRQKTQERL